MIDIQKIAEQSGMTQYVAAENKYLEKFAALIREAVVQELVAGSGGFIHTRNVDGVTCVSTAEAKEHTAGAIARERERCARICETSWQLGIGGQYQGDVFAVAIRSGDGPT